MKTVLSALVAQGRHQTVKLARRLAGEPVLRPRFLGQTLGADDAALAEFYLEAIGCEAASGGPDLESAAATIRAYESQFAAVVGSRHATSFRSGREAFSACLEALDLPPGAEVILPGYTCVVMPNAVRFAGLVPVFADIELQTYGLSLEALETKLGPQTGAIVLQHLYGLVCRDYEAILELAASREIPVIEDCAHALGASYRGRPVGSRGTLAFFSTEQSKVLCTVTGGMAVASELELSAELATIQERAAFPEPDWVERALRTLLLLYYNNHEQDRRLYRSLINLRYGPDAIVSTSKAEQVGERPLDYGRRLPSPLAAIGCQQLEKLPRFSQRRRAAALRWDDWCSERGLSPPLVLEGSEPAFLRYPVCVEPERKSDLRWAERELGFAPGVWFSGTLHPVQHDLPDCPLSHIAVSRCINLPTLP